MFLMCIRTAYYLWCVRRPLPGVTSRHRLAQPCKVGALSALTASGGRGVIIVLATSNSARLSGLLQPWSPQSSWCEEAVWQLWLRASAACPMKHIPAPRRHPALQSLPSGALCTWAALLLGLPRVHTPLCVLSNGRHDAWSGGSEGMASTVCVCCWCRDASWHGHSQSAPPKTGAPDQARTLRPGAVGRLAAQLEQRIAKQRSSSVEPCRPSAGSKAVLALHILTPLASPAGPCTTACARSSPPNKVVTHRHGSSSACR